MVSFAVRPSWHMSLPALPLKSLPLQNRRPAITEEHALEGGSGVGLVPDVDPELKLPKLASLIIMITASTLLQVWFCLYAL
jgi:hypothetical protein